MIAAVRAWVCVLAQGPPDDTESVAGRGRGSGRGAVRAGRRAGHRQGKADGVRAYARPGKPARGDATFPKTTRALEVMRDWLLDRGVTIAAMESTLTCWKPAFYCLEEVLEVWLVNAVLIKAVPRRKTDVKDAEWIAQLLSTG